VSISGLSLPKTAQSFNVYRGSNPQSLYQIASACEIAASFTDPGLAARPRGLPDRSFDHANFYYRYEYAGPFTATNSSSTSIACRDMGAVNQAYLNMVVRIIEGKGLGQERQIAANDAITITTSSPWTVNPDATSQFVISEASWKFAAVSTTSPATFQLPYRAGTILQISGRAANVLDQEATPELSPLTRMTLGGQTPDFGVSDIPTFALDAPGAGELVLSTIGFADKTNVGSIASGTLSLYSINELAGPTGYLLSSAVDAISGTFAVSEASSDLLGAVIQVGTELVSVIGVDNSERVCTVMRGVLNSSAVAHAAGENLWPIQRSIIIVPFAPNFFENRASVNYLHSFALPDARVAASEFFVTNSFGDSQTEVQCYTPRPSRGLRTLSGGQFALQTNGSISTQLNAAPPLMIQADHAIRDIRADLGRSAQGYDVNVEILQAGKSFCSLQISANQVESPILDGLELPILRKLLALSMNVTLQPVKGFQGTLTPPRDLTVTIRL
jgi:hypothetical protein